MKSADLGARESPSPGGTAGVQPTPSGSAEDAEVEQPLLQERCAPFTFLTTREDFARRTVL